MEFSFPSNISIYPVTPIFSSNRAKNHLHNKLNRKQLPLWFCFAFTTRNIDQNTATKSLYAGKTAGNSIAENRPIMHCKLSIWQMYIMYANRLCLSCYLTDSKWLLYNKYLWHWSDECCWRYICNWINITVSKFLGYFVRYFGNFT